MVLYRIDVRTSKNNYIFNVADYLVGSSKIPRNISYYWNLGSVLGLSLITQIVSGVSLSFHYIPTTKSAFKSVQNIMIDENYGWLLRYSHANGASLFFVAVYIHIGRSLYFQSYLPPRTLLWNIGVVIYVVMMGTAFLGYVLPYGNMSLWGAIVITNFFSTIPWLGGEIVYFIWGGYSVDYPTLNRFYGLHYTLPWIILGLVILHILTLHDKGSNNPLGINIKGGNAYFHPYFTYKDIITFILYFIILIFLIGYYPNYLGHSDNYIKADPLVTPSSIVPEWYFLPFYGILRSIPDKSLGVVSLAASILILFIIPLIFPDHVRSCRFKSQNSDCFWSFVITFIGLIYVGGAPVQYPFVLIAQLLTLNYFTTLLILPLMNSLFYYTLFLY